MNLFDPYRQFRRQQVQEKDERKRKYKIFSYVFWAVISFVIGFLIGTIYLFLKVL